MPTSSSQSEKSSSRPVCSTDPTSLPPSCFRSRSAERLSPASCGPALCLRDSRVEMRSPGRS